MKILHDEEVENWESGEAGDTGGAAGISECSEKGKLESAFEGQVLPAFSGWPMG